MRPSLSLILLVAAGQLGCEQDEPIVGKNPPPAAELTPPTQLCRARADSGRCRDADDVEELLERGDLEILGVARTPSGIQGARVLTLRAAGGKPIVFRAKWRPHSTTTSRNSPRRELGAYAVQKLFLEPDEYVVPPTAPHCFPIEMIRARVNRRARPTFPGVKCVYGILSYWLEDVQSLADAERAGWFHGVDDHAFDSALFDDNDTYRDSIADVNLFTYVIGHADSHARNFVITLDRAAPLVYSVDNSLSLGLARNRNLAARHDWSRIRVPALSRDAVDRLRDGRALEALGAVAVLEVKGEQLVVADVAAARPTARGTEWIDGRLTVGLTPSEISGVRRRIADLLRRLDARQIAVF